MEYEYRILVDGEAITAWTANLSGVIAQAQNFRMIFSEGEVLSIEIASIEKG